MNRKELVNTIIDLSSDEVDEELLIILAQESYEELVERLAGIAEYYWHKTK